MSLPKGWKMVRLDEAARVVSGATPKTGSAHFWDGDIVWVTPTDLGKLQSSYISASSRHITRIGLKNCAAEMLPVGSIVMSSRAPIGHLAVAKVELCTNQGCKSFVPKPGTDSRFLYFALRKAVPAIKELGCGGTFQEVSKTLLSSFQVPLPPLPEQIEIARILGVWDAAIGDTTQLIAAKIQHKRGLMQQLLFGERRFAESVQSDQMRQTKHGLRPQDWDDLCVGDFADEVSERNAEQSFPVLSCTKHKGLVNSLEYFGKQVHSENLANYKVVRRNQFAYATNHIEEGSIGLLSDIEAGVVSPMYTVFKLSDQVDSRFLYALFKTEHYRQIFAANTNASVDRRGSLRWKNFALLPIALPTLAEQRRIADVLDAATAEIQLLQKQLDALKTQKRGLMQLLLSGEKSVAVANAGNLDDVTRSNTESER